MSSKQDETSPSASNPVIEEQLEALTNLVCEKLSNEQNDFDERAEPLLKALVMGGYARRHDNDIRSELESRVKDQCSEPAMHRGGALSSISEQLQSKLKDLVRWESEQPGQDSPANAANTNAATDA